MGDRAIVIVRSGGNVAACGVYVHWAGAEMPELIKGAAGRMRCSDPDYATARLIHHICEETGADSALSVGVISLPDDMSEEFLPEYSHGDAGVLVVDMETGQVSAYGGYTASFQIDPSEFYQG